MIKTFTKTHQIGPFYIFFLREACHEPPSKAHGVTIINLKKNGAPPLPNPGYVPLACSKSN